MVDYVRDNGKDMLGSCYNYGGSIFILETIVCVLAYFCQDQVFVGMLAYFALVLVITLSLNIADKCIARDWCCDCCWRVPECVLHFCSLIGGAPSTAFAMNDCCIRHKRSKVPYQEVFLCCAKCCIALLVVAIIALIIAIAYRKN